MTGRTGIIGAGHLAGYLLEGFHKRNPGGQVLVSDRNPGRAANLADKWGARTVAGNQALVSASDLVILAVRPQDALPACRALAFRAGQIVASAVAGLALAELEPAVAPARAVRVMPISSAALNGSPTLVFPGHPAVVEGFSPLGRVHVLPDEAGFTAASVIAAFYGWMYALADETIAWSVERGVPPEVARPLVMETIRSTADMALANPGEPVRDLLDRLATPGGITEYGLGILRRNHGLGAWSTALDAVLERISAR